MKYYVTIDMIKDQLNTNKFMAQKIFREAKRIDKNPFTSREVSAKSVNCVIGYREFIEPSEERRERT
ncbi:MAG: hypothetical protein CVU94_02005 [Firmicutes bacterium HGW-Firmicutes-19]|nr:MAG: hypothetical protein CVU94_02005 [Firmicutes bacterium HGW-Firmicutes-19]